MTSFEFRKMNYITVYVRAAEDTGEFTALSFRRNRTLNDQKSCTYMHVFQGKNTIVFVVGKGAYMYRPQAREIAILAAGDPAYCTTQFGTLEISQA